MRLSDLAFYVVDFHLFFTFSHALVSLRLGAPLSFWQVSGRPLSQSYAWADLDGGAEAVAAAWAELRRSLEAKGALMLMSHAMDQSLVLLAHEMGKHSSVVCARCARKSFHCTAKSVSLLLYGLLAKVSFG